MLYGKKKYIALLFMIPFAVFAITFLFYPAVINVVNSFRSFSSMFDTTPEWTGFKNIIWLANQPSFWNSLLNTLILVLFVIVFQMGLALVFALMVNSIKKMATFYRVVFFFPIVVSASALGTIYRLMIQPDSVFSAIFGLENFNWLPSGSFLALFIVMLPVIWQYIGFYFVIMLTGLANISDDLMEAAKLDGASSMKLIWYILLPMLWNVFRTCMVLAITGALKVFDFPHIVAKGGAPAGETFFMGTYNNYLYESKFYGQTAFYSTLIVIVGMAVSLLSNAILRENKDI